MDWPLPDDDSGIIPFIADIKYTQTQNVYNDMSYNSSFIISSFIINLTSMFFQDQSRVWTAASQQHNVDNQPLAT